MSKLSLFLLTLVMALSLTGTATAANDGGSRLGKVRFAASADICNSWFHRVYGPDGEQIDMSNNATGSLTAGVSLFDRRLYVGLGFTKLDNDPIRPALQTTWNVLPSRFTPFVDLKASPTAASLGGGVKYRFFDRLGLFVMAEGLLCRSRVSPGLALGLSYGF